MSKEQEPTEVNPSGELSWINKVYNDLKEIKGFLNDCNENFENAEQNFKQLAESQGGLNRAFVGDRDRITSLYVEIERLKTAVKEISTVFDAHRLATRHRFDDLNRRVDDMKQSMNAFNKRLSKEGKDLRSRLQEIENDLEIERRANNA